MVDRLCIATAIEQLLADWPPETKGRGVNVARVRRFARDSGFFIRASSPRAIEEGGPASSAAHQSSDVVQHAPGGTDGDGFSRWPLTGDYAQSRASPFAARRHRFISAASNFKRSVLPTVGPRLHEGRSLHRQRLCHDDAKRRAGVIEVRWLQLASRLHFGSSWPRGGIETDDGSGRGCRASGVEESSRGFPSRASRSKVNSPHAVRRLHPRQINKIINVGGNNMLPNGRLAKGLRAGVGRPDRRPGLTCKSGQRDLQQHEKKKRSGATDRGKRSTLEREGRSGPPTVR